MTKYICDVCNDYTYDDTEGDEKLGIKVGTKPEDFPKDWVCPVCFSDKTHMKKI